jgi:hypothetical protein
MTVRISTGAFREVFSWIIGMIITGVLLMMPASSGFAQSQEPADRTVDAALQAQIIDSVCAALNEVYVFPDVAKKMEQHIRKQYKEKKYSDLVSLSEFARKLTDDLREICRDRHLGIRFMSEEFVQQVVNDTLTDEARRRNLEERQRDNFGFRELKILRGNVGYVDLRSFSEAADAGPTAIAAMNFLAHTDAIIFDLRQNGGGSPSMIQLLTSYFVDEPTHLNSFYVRKEDSINQFWTHAWVPGPRMTDAKLYVLTSKYTFSGAEEFTYNLKNLERATIIGETTGGGAHPIERRVFANLNVGMSLPYGRAINPITGTNWEGTGVEPHVAIDADQAFDVAYLRALEDLAAEEDDPDRRFEMDWAITSLKVKQKPVSLSTESLEQYSGSYGPRQVRFRDGLLYYQREENPEFLLIPLGDDMFMLKGLDYFRVQFVKDDSGGFHKIVGLYDDGHSDLNMRDE